MIPLPELRRIKRDLKRASDRLSATYPFEDQDWTGSAPDMETSRNLDTALAEIEGWIAFRFHNGRDPFLKARSQDGTTDRSSKPREEPNLPLSTLTEEG